MTADSIKIDFEPIGKRVEVAPGLTLLEAAHQAGIELIAVCGGAGTCAQCQVQIMDPHPAPPNAVETDVFTPRLLAAGWRLACQTVVSAPLKVHVPPDSLTTPQRLQLEGIEAGPALRSDFELLDVQVTSQELEQLSADAPPVEIAPGVPVRFPAEQPGLWPAVLSALRENAGKLRLVLRDGQVAGFVRFAEPAYGLAVDLGTTKIAAFLVELQSNRVAARASAMNPQIHYGEDVISRILYCMEHPDGRQTMQEKVVAALNQLVRGMCAELSARPSQVVAAALVGNTAMNHLFAGLPVEQLGMSPFSPATTQAFSVPSAEIGLSLASQARVYLPENIAGFVGGDHVAMMVATRASQKGSTVLALDIGTNTEVSLTHEGKVYTCSCASGPTFEGAHIQEGMRAADGAIERIKIDDGQILTQTIGGQPAIGICGSGILDAVAEMLKNGILDRRGNFDSQSGQIRGSGRNREFVLVPAEQSGCSRDIVVTRKDINEVLLAKAAIQTGIEILLMTAGIPAERIEEFIIAGAFGSYLDVKSAIQIGMFPQLPLERFSQVGNAAGSGARMLLVSDEIRRQAADFTHRSQYVELTLYPGFQEVYIRSLRFETY